MRKAIAAMVLALTFAAGAAPASAAPLSPLTGLTPPAPLTEQIHCRRYWHCHRRCWWNRAGYRQCRRFCR